MTWADGARYEGEWKDGKRSGQGVYTWADGRRYEWEWKDGWRSGRGVRWLPDERTYDGAWARDRPLQGTAMEPDGALSRATFDGETWIEDGWHKAQRVPAGRIVSGRPPARPRSSGTLVPPDIRCQTMISYNTLLYHRYGYMIS